ncbi:dTDP-4-dehydrorhamnose reductase [Pseudaquidulcibacter saccharophilus]|uniref:dTDP-4-dehydrorhamnose reductase n=1 Tax=Pseudaquidulcibacter saccharophilus TaxID=2831900 RepID=UPI001EFF5B37|nr:dTDP-4-dehydrorhamnose reductase [Pseudaquidulcibacter saccharophilus]
MRILVTGKSGQVSQSLQKLATDEEVELIVIGRPEIDFERPYNLEAEIIKIAPDVVISAAAYTMVDKAETDVEIAKKVNSEAPAIIATACKYLDIPLLHLSTDYVYSGEKIGAYVELDAANPKSVYGKTKLDGENAIASIYPNHVILRTAWVYSPFGKNFVKTMLALGESRDEISVVADQFGCPSSAMEIAKALIKIAKKVCSEKNDDLRGVFHIAGRGETNWSGFAKEIFELSGMNVKVNEIPSAAYPTPAVRPTNSRLDCDKLWDLYKIELPLWQDSLKECLKILKYTS